MKYKFLAIFLLISMVLSANSIFSYYGMANQYLGNDLYSAGMSDAGKNDLFRINTSYSNPSILTSSNKVIFSTATSFGKQNYYDDNGSSFKDDGFYLPYFTAAFPVLNHRFGLQYSLLYSGNLDTYGTGVFTSEDEEEFSYDTKNSIISNVFKVDLSYALKNRFVNIGIAGNYYLGHRIQYWEYDFENSTLLDSEYEKEELFKNPGYTLGLSKRLKSISFGLSYSSKVKLEGDVDYKYGFSNEPETVEEAVYLFEVPAKISAGFTWKFVETFKLHSTFDYQMWSDTDSYDKDTATFALGLSYDPLSGYGKWYESIPLRAGFSFRELPFEINNEPITELKGSFGFSAPLKSANKRIDFGVTYLTRGDKELHGISEDSLMFSIGVTGFDIFSKKAKKIAPRDIPKAD